MFTAHRGIFSSKFRMARRSIFFYPANSDYPKKLEAAGLSVSGTYYEYARGHIVLLTSSASTLDLQQGLKVLLEPSVKRIAIAN